MSTPLPLQPAVTPSEHHRGRGPFATSAPGIVAATIHLAAAWVWLVAGAHLPGGRWLTVHLVTLGVLGNVVLVFSQHFSVALTKATPVPTWRLVLGYNAGAAAVLVGLPAGRPGVVAAGAASAAAAVAGSYVVIRRRRRSAPDARFAWVVRAYERAHGAFLHGALLGALLGAGVLRGDAYAAARLAHLHVNVLGWGGLTLLATLLFFAPTMVRTRLRDGDEDVAARWLPIGATGLTVAVLALLVSGAGGTAGVPLRFVASAGLAVLAGAATAVLSRVWGTVGAAAPSAARPPLLAVCAWFVAALWADAVVVASGAWRFLEPLGLVAIVGVLVPAILATLAYLAPVLRLRDARARDRLRVRLDRRAGARTVVYNLGVFALVAGAAHGLGGGDGSTLTRGGWVLTGITVAHLAGAALRPVRTT